MQALDSGMIWLTIVAYFLSMMVYWLFLGVKSNIIERIAKNFAIIGFFSNTVVLAVRIEMTQRLPLTNSFEFILAFCWAVTAIFLAAEIRYKLKNLGSFVMPVPFLLLLFIVLTKGAQMREIQAIPPALKSMWLYVHVASAILAYAGFAVSFGLAMMYLLRVKAFSTKFMDTERLDVLIYKVIAFAFFLLTLVIITGAVWANYAWGSYWSWDPKETWSLITWIIYAIYLHVRLTYGWKGKRAVWLAVLGFIAVLFTFLGVNYLLPGLHTYV